MEKGFTYLHQGINGLHWNILYSGSHNITGKPLAGYKKNIPIGTVALKKALERAAALAAPMGLCLFVFDTYRPQKAVDDLVKWAGEAEDGKTKEQFYPSIPKEEMIARGYIAEKSGHSRGSVADLTLMNKGGVLLDMGTAFDFMDEKSHHGTDEIHKEAAQNRRLLLEIMEKSGFASYEKEWWHYRLKEEPFPHRYFDFNIE